MNGKNTKKSTKKSAEKSTKVVTTKKVAKKPLAPDQQPGRIFIADKIVALLRKKGKPMTKLQIATDLGMTKNQITEPLSRLRLSGVLADFREGREICFALNGN